MLDQYPVVLHEYETIERLLRTGESLARFGDGEAKMMRGVGNKYEEYNAALAEELKEIVAGNYENVAVGIPAIRPGLPRTYWWEPWKVKLLPFLSPDVEYCSSFVSRPDHVPHIAQEPGKFGELVSRLWRGKYAVLVGSGASLRPEDMEDAYLKDYVVTSGRNDFEQIKEIEARIVAANPEVTVLCAGMTATCLVPRLTARGIKAYDLGAFGQRKLWKIAADINAGVRKE